jgi:hypothetical protein
LHLAHVTVHRVEQLSWRAIADDEPSDESRRVFSQSGEDVGSPDRAVGILEVNLEHVAARLARLSMRVRGLCHGDEDAGAIGDSHCQLQWREGSSNLGPFLRG